MAHLFRANKNIVFASASLIITGIIYLWFKNIFVDDTGFVVRYLRQAADGCFYCYNGSEGPVYGISSFLYGFVSSILALPNLFKPEHIIIGLNFMGLLWLVFILLKTLYLLCKNVFLSIVGLMLAILMSSKFLASTTIGLETNFHLAIVFTAVYFFFTQDKKKMWLFLALSVISKLDTVPLVLVLSGIHILENWSNYFKTEWKQNWKIIALYAIVPLVVFIGLTFLLFDGPMPQSAYAKVNFHKNPSEHWFPFWELMYDKGERKSIVKLALGLIMLHGLISLYLKQFKLRDFALFLGFIGTMGLFYLYNPAERMLWYYAMPELLLFVQAVYSGQKLVQGFDQIKQEDWVLMTKYTLLSVGFVLAAWPLTSNEKAWMDQSLMTTEKERLEIGSYIADRLVESDTLIASHGHFGAHTDAYVLDMSGLNSKLATDYERNMDEVLKDFRPGWYIHHSHEQFIHLAYMHGYHVDNAWFNINKYGYPSWVLFKRNEPGETLFNKRLHNEGWQAQTQSFKEVIEVDYDITRLIFGIENPDPENDTDVEILVNGQSVKIFLPSANKLADTPHEKVQTIDIKLDKPSKKLEFQIVQDWMVVYDPIIEMIRPE